MSALARLTATENAMLHTARARALARMGRAGETLAAVGRADDYFAGQDPSRDPSWMSYYDAAQHAGDTGHALYDLAMMGRFVSEARTRLTDAVGTHTAPYARSRAISQTKLASLLMVAGDLAEGVATGTHALHAAENIRSRRAADDLRELARHTARHIRHDDVAALRDEIARVLQPA